MSEEQPKARASRLRRAGRWAAAALALAVIAFLALRGYYGGRLDAERQKLHDLGLPTTMAGMAGLYPEVPGDENAAPRFMAAVDALVNDQETAEMVQWASMHDTFETPTPVAPDGLAMMRRHLERNGEAFRLAQEAAALPRAHYAVDLAEWPAMSLDHLPELRQIGKLGQITMIVEAYDHDAVRYLDGAGVLYGAARSLLDEPLQISQLTRRALEGWLFNEIDRGLRLGMLDSGTMAALQELLTELERREDVSRAFAIEATHMAARLREDGASEGREWSRALYRSVLGTGPRHFLQELGLGRVVPFIFRHTKLTEAAVAEKTAVGRIAYDAASGPYSEAPSKLAPIDQRLRSSRAITMRLAQMYGGSPAYILRSLATHRAHRRLWITRLALERYRRGHGKFPYELQALVPGYLDAVPRDPKDGQPLEYNPPVPNGAIYSDLDAEITIESRSAETTNNETSATGSKAEHPSP